MNFCDIHFIYIDQILCHIYEVVHKENPIFFISETKKKLTSFFSPLLLLLANTFFIREIIVYEFDTKCWSKRNILFHIRKDG